jgi:hypothetical protein
MPTRSFIPLPPSFAGTASANILEVMQYNISTWILKNDYSAGGDPKGKRYGHSEWRMPDNGSSGIIGCSRRHASSPKAVDGSIK